MLNTKIAQQIVEKTSKICGHNIVIIDCLGIIIAAYDKQRIGTVHEGLEPVLKNMEVLIHSEEEAKCFKGAQAGMALPIVVNSQVIGAVGITGDPKEIKKYGELVKNQVEMMYQQAMFFEFSKIKSEAIDSLLQELLGPNLLIQDLSYLKSLGQILGYNLQIPRVAFIVELYDYKKIPIVQLIKNEEKIYLSYIKNVLQAIQYFIDDKKENIVAKNGSNRFIIFKTLEDSKNSKYEFTTITKRLEDYLKNEIKTNCIIGIGSFHSELIGLKQSYREAEQALIIAQKMGHTQGTFHIEELPIGLILNDTSEITRTKILNGANNFNTTEFKDLINTLYVFFDNDLNLAKAARELFIHRNTLIYRLNRIKIITGFDPNNFKDAMTLYLISKLTEFKDHDALLPS